MIPFNIPPYLGIEDEFVLQAMHQSSISGDGEFSRKCQEWFEYTFGISKALMTPSCTHALEMAALLMDIRPGDEIIMPSYTFVSTANAFVLRGAKIVFVDIRPDTMNIDEKLIEPAVTSRTKAIVPVHYGGVSCEMDYIMEIADKYGLYVVEDAAQGVMATYKERYLGTIGQMGTYSFHETKNYTSGGEGGLLSINDNRFIERAEILREKGTNRSQFFRGQIDKYSWVDLGSSYLPSELQAAYLFAELIQAEKILKKRLEIWQRYRSGLSCLETDSKIEFQKIPPGCQHNGHLFYIKVEDLTERTKMLEYLNKKGILAVFHYVPLHNSLAGKKYGYFHGVDRYTTRESERLIRLPLYYSLNIRDQEKVIDSVLQFYS